MNHILPDHRGAVRVATISDIHSNWAALEAVLSYLQETERPDVILFMGDYVTDFPDPQRTLNLVRQAASQVPTSFIRGNREEYLLDGFHPDTVDHNDYSLPSTQAGSLIYTARRLTPEDWVWFDQLPIHAQLKIGQAPPITVCHGSPSNSRALLYPGTEALQHTTQNLNTELLIHGHTHHRTLIQTSKHRIVGVGQIAYNIRREHWSEQRFSTYLANPQPNSTTAYASLTMLDWTPGTPTAPANPYTLRFLDIPYDPAELTRNIRVSELSTLAPWWAEAVTREMLSGEDYLLALLKQAQQLAAQDGITTDILPEHYYAKSFALITQREAIRAKYPAALIPYLR